MIQTNIFDWENTPLDTAKEEKLKAAERRMKEEARLYKLAKKMKLKPCPFCGGNAAIIWRADSRYPNRYSVGCVDSKGKCIVRPSVSYGDGVPIEEIPELIDAWNKRAGEPKHEHNQR